MAENFLIKPTIVQTGQTATTATVRITVSAKSSSYYGPSPTSSAIILQGPNGYHKFWGFPTASKWKSSWGKPNATYLKNGGAYTFSKYGTLHGMLQDRTYSWTETVQIPYDGVKRQRTKTIKAAQIYTGSHQNFKTVETSFEVKTTEIQKPAIQEFRIEVDDKDQQAERNIHVYAKHTNYKDPSNKDYYTSYLINTKTGEKVMAGLYGTQDGVTSRHWIIKITEDMYQDALSFELQVVGKDGTVYCRKIKTTEVIAPDGVGLWFRGATSSDINKITNVDFKNNSYREVKEVWVYIDGKWRKTKK